MEENENFKLFESIIYQVENYNTFNDINEIIQSSFGSDIINYVNSDDDRIKKKENYLRLIDVKNINN